MEWMDEYLLSKMVLDDGFTTNASTSSAIPVDELNLEKVWELINEHERSSLQVRELTESFFKRHGFSFENGDVLILPKWCLHFIKYPIPGVQFSLEILDKYIFVKGIRC